MEEFDLIKRMEAVVMKCKDKVKKIKKVEALFRKDIKIAFLKHNQQQSKSFDIEAEYDILVDELKEKLISVLYDNQEEACLDAEDIEENLNEEF